MPFTTAEIEEFRQLVFDNLTRGLRYVFDAMQDMQLSVDPENLPYVQLVDEARDLRDGEPFPLEYHGALRSLWEDANLQRTMQRGNEAALPEK